MVRLLVLLALLVSLPAAVLADDIALQLVATGLARPVGIAHAGDTRLFIVEQRGTIAVFDGTRVLPTFFLDIRSQVRTSGSEQGLLGMAFHPRYAENGFFYINYTDVNGDTAVVRYNVSASDPNRADSSTARLILHVDQPFANHNGGQLQFGPDGYLYIGLGDGGSGGDPGNRAQNLNELLGKMLRIDVDSGTPYAIPPSNPFVNQGGVRPEIWSYGLRNPWRYSFDRASGDLWIADVGQGLWEEVNVQPGTSIGGENYGWKRMEGTHCFSPTSNCNTGSLVLPVIEYNHSNGACSVTGGHVYRGAQYPLLRGTYIYGDYCNGIIWGATPSETGYTSRVLTDASFFISTFGEDVAGEMYVADHGGGRILKIADTRVIAPRRRAVRH